MGKSLTGASPGNLGLGQPQTLPKQCFSLAPRVSVFLHDLKEVFLFEGSGWKRYFMKWTHGLEDASDFRKP